MTTISFNQFAFNLGKLRKSTREASLPLHQAYVKATPEQQADLRERWILNHLDGQGLNGGEILPMPRTKRTKAQQQAYDCARQDFAYHVVRKVKKPAAAAPAPAKRERISKHLRELAQALIDAAGDKATALKVLRAI